ncbi:MAG: ion transporter [Chloroflexi bacterium]|nr:ion transporter [Chloroflexota bacterium]
MRELAGRITGSRPFEYFIIALILGNGAVLGLETVERIGDEFLTWFEVAHTVTLAIFIVEAALKMLALAPQSQRYFRDGWNIFDFSIIVLSLIPAVGPFAVVARMARLMRVLRLVSAMPELRLIVSTLVRSIPGMLHIVAVMSVLTYIYAILGFHFFHEHDPEHWRNLGISLLSLFRVVTLEDWTDIMYVAMDLHPLAWVYFLSFVVLGSFVTINLFIAVVINNLDEAKQERLRQLETATTADEVIAELRAARESLNRLERRLVQVQSETGG